MIYRRTDNVLAGDRLRCTLGSRPRRCLLAGRLTQHLPPTPPAAAWGVGGRARRTLTDGSPGELPLRFQV